MFLIFRQFDRISTSVWLAAFVLLALLPVWLTRETVMGDAFIHFTFARGIASGEPFFYNGVFSAGSTSPLWSALLAPAWAALGDGVIYFVKGFGAVFVGLSVVLTYLLAARLTHARSLALVASFLIAGNFLLSWWAAKGMETPFFVALVLGDLLLYVQLLERPTRQIEVWLGVLLGLTILTRPEGWFLAAFVSLPLLIRSGWRTILTIGLPAAIICLPYYIYLFTETGQIWPSSAARVLHARQWGLTTLGVHWTPEIFKILLTKYLPLTPFFLVFVWQYREAGTKPSWKFVPLFCWLGFHLLFFSFVMPTSQGERYLLPAVPPFVILSLLGLWHFYSRPRVWLGLLAFVLAGSVGISAQQLMRQVQKITVCEKPAIDQVRRETGLWLRDHTRPTDLIALKEVDQAAYYSGRPVLSMDGTLDTAAVPFVRAHDQLGFLRERRPQYLVLEEDMYRLYPDWQKSNLMPLADPTLLLGQTRRIDDTFFTLEHRIRLGDEATCSHFRGEYFWYFYRVHYLR